MMTKTERERRKADRVRRKGLLARATPEGVRGIADELAILCHDCRRPMLILVPENQMPVKEVRCIDCGSKHFGRPKS
jgi:DNA-directed RNA polymerase subunit RPC12/RpoP